MRIYTIQKLIIRYVNGMFSYYQIDNTLDVIKIINNNYDELVNKYKHLYLIEYINRRLIIHDEIIFNSNPKEYFVNGIYKSAEDSEEYYLISFIDV